MSGNDGHAVCLYCLGVSHARNAYEDTGPMCSHCDKMEINYKKSRLTRVTNFYLTEFGDQSQPTRGPSPPPPPPRDPWPSHVLTGEGQRAAPKRKLDYAAAVRRAPASSSQAAAGQERPIPAPRSRAPATVSSQVSVVRAYDAQTYEACGARPKTQARPPQPAQRAAQQVVIATVECPPKPAPRLKQPAVATSSMVDHLDPSPERRHLSWGDQVEEGELSDEELPSFQYHDGDYVVVDEDYGADQDYVLPTDGEEDEVMLRRPFQDDADVDMEEYGDQQVDAPAAPPPQPYVELQRDDSHIMDIYKKAALRCGHVWPESSTKRVVWQGRTETELPALPPKKQKLPQALGFHETMVLAWKDPIAKTEFTPRSAKGVLEMVDMDTMAIDVMPPMDKAMASYLANPQAPRIITQEREPVFTSATDKEASKVNKWLYGHMSFVAKGLNAGALLQGSMKALLLEMGNSSSPAQLAELRRLNHEMANLQCEMAEHTGQAMVSSVLQERWRWVNLAPLSDAIKKDMVSKDISHKGLFHDVLENMSITIQQAESSTKTMKALEPLAAQAPPGRAKAKPYKPRAESRAPPRAPDSSGDRQQRPAGRSRPSNRNAPPTYKAKDAPRGRGAGKRK